MKRLFSLFCLFPLFLFAAGNWQTFTNTSEIRAVTIVESTLWAATNGGVLSINTDTQEYTKYTNTEGLEQIDVVTLAYDPNNFVWAAMPDGLLQILNVATGEWDIYNEFQNEVNVHAITPHSDFVLVGFENGIAELKLDSKQRWERTWKADIGNVNTILITDAYIWVGQDDGVRRIPIDFTNKQIPNAWDYFSVTAGLPGGSINALYEFDNQIVAGSSNGVAYFDGLVWQNIELSGQVISSICSWNNQLTVASDAGVQAKSSSGTWTLLPNSSKNGSVVAETLGHVLWLGTLDDGLFWWENSQWNAMPINGPNSNTFSDMLIDRDGHLWVTSSKNPTGGVYYYDGTTWINFSRPDGLATFDYRSIEEDADGRIWAGSYGGGVTLFEKVSEDSITFTNLRDMDGNLAYAGTSVGYVVVIDMIYDDFDNMWFLTLDAGNKQALQVYNIYTQDWQYWTTMDGIRNVKTSCIAIDADGRKWIGTGAPNGVGGSGLSVLDDNGTPFDKTDDDLTGFLNEAEGLEDDNITSLSVDLDGTMWIGTVRGLNYWFLGNVGARYNTINDNIQALYVDPRNNKWIGTVGGLSVLDSDNYSWTHYTTSNSSLVSDLVTCFAFDEDTGEIYIGTANGLSRFETPFTKPAATLSSVVGYPNPFHLNEDNARFYIDNLALKSNVSIFTADGHLVKTIPPDEILGAKVSWDGTNNKGEQVATGVYIYLVTTQSGQSASGKIALIR